MALEAIVAQARSHTVGDIPRRSARTHPGKVAIIDGEVTLTFAEFDRLVDRAAAALNDNGFGPGDRGALLAHNCWQYAVLAFATARAAVVLVPSNFMLTEEIAYILRHSNADVRRARPSARGGPQEGHDQDRRRERRKPRGGRSALPAQRDRGSCRLRSAARGVGGGGGRSDRSARRCEARRGRDTAALRSPPRGF